MVDSNRKNISPLVNDRFYADDRFSYHWNNSKFAAQRIRDVDYNISPWNRYYNNFIFSIFFCKTFDFILRYEKQR